MESPARLARPRVRLRGAGGASLAIALLALLVWLGSRADVHLAVAGALAFAVVIDAFAAWRAVAKVDVDLVRPLELPAGEPSTWEVRVGGWRRPVTVVPRLFAGAQDVLVNSDLPGVLVWPPLRRGLAPFAVVDVASVGPLGLSEAARRQVVRFATPVPVTPPLVEADVRWPRPRAVAFGMTEGAPIGDDLYRSVRPYRSGDERRRVHWKSTARHGELMVRESDGTGIVQVRIVVDLGPAGPAAERTAGTAAWLAASAIARGWEVELVTLDASSQVPTLASVGRPFGRPPVLSPPAVVSLPTVCAPVRSAAEARRRLATAAHGTPAEPASGAWRGRRCLVSQAGIEWS